MLAQTTARDIHSRGVRSQAATGSDPDSLHARSLANVSVPGHVVSPERQPLTPALANLIKARAHPFGIVHFG
jgi:hypothetical protein